MLLTLPLPRINEYMASATIKSIYAAIGESLSPGAKLLDLSVDLGAAAPHDCPPVSLYRIALRDRVWLRRLAVAPSDDVRVGAVMAHFSTEPDEPLDGQSVRPVRISIAGILDPSDWWSERRQ